MRTTITLEQDVERLVKEAMVRGDKSFKQVINEALRRSLRGDHTADEEPFVVHSKPMGLRVGMDPARLTELVDELEGDDYRRKLQTLMGHRIHDRS